MDKRKNNGAKTGENRGQGRKPKATELELIELLSPLDAIAFKALEKGVKAGEFSYIKLFFEYRYGKAKQLDEVQGQKNIIIKVIDEEQEEQTFMIGGKEIRF